MANWRGTWQRLGLHVLRVALVAGVFVLIHLRHRPAGAPESTDAVNAVTLPQVQAIVPNAASLAPAADDRVRDILDATGERLGFCLTTSPAGDHSIGFSGPTNVLIVCDPSSRILGLAILFSRDTREHADQVRRDGRFLSSYRGLTLAEAAQRTRVDAVAGATLTSDAIVEAILRRLGVAAVSVKFPEPVTLAEVRTLFPTAESLAVDDDEPEIAHVYGANRARLGSCLRTAPAGDNKIGYQGPTEALIGFDMHGQVVGFILRKSFDNAEYVETVRGDEYFRHLFDRKTRQQLAQVQPQPPDVEGVSGSTMTSLAVAEALVAAAKARRAAPSTRSVGPVLSGSDYGVFAIVLLAVLVAFTNLRGVRWLRVALALATIGYLGFATATLLSQAQLVGWAQSGLPRTAAGLVVLTAAALVLPITTKRNVYCTHLCPHGAAQQLVKLVAKPRYSLGRRWRVVIAAIPVALLALVIVVALRRLPFSLVDLEPFDAYVPRIAGYATLTIAIIGLLASAFTPMAYCRYGCPTGLLLEFLRRNAHSGHLSRRDLTAILLFALALVCFFA